MFKFTHSPLEQVLRSSAYLLLFKRNTMTKKKNNRGKKVASKKNNKQAQQLKELTQAFLGHLQADPLAKISLKQFFKKNKVRQRTVKTEFSAVAEALANQGIVERVNRVEFRAGNAKEIRTQFEGKVDYVSRDFGYIVCDDFEDDIRVSSKNMRNALHGDRVRVRLTSMKGRSGRPEGEVQSILEEGKRDFVGRVELLSNFAFVIPDSKRMHFDIFIPQSEIKGAQHGDKVVAKIKRWGERDRNPIGKITDVLGQAGEHNVEMHAIIHEFGFDTAFPEEVEKEANALSEEISAEEYAKRRDFRDVTTFTIDPDTAKDFDDAISIKELPHGNLEIGIHIADVAHFVRPGTVLDREARRRATSVYLVDRTIPMLPERISNGLCSLRPQEEKCTFSAVFELSPSGKILSRWFGRGVIFSDRRFTYEEAQERIEGLEGDFAKEIRQLNVLARLMREKRFQKGAMDFDLQEIKVIIDEVGNPTAIVPRDRKEAHMLVEEFMLLANREVAKFVYEFKGRKEKNVMVYRTHDKPDPEKIANLAEFSRRFGYTLETDETQLSASMRRLTQDSKGKPEHPLIQYLALRSMSKAIYETKCKGHFGLAFEHYTHFTSPIRRYPDVMAHRFLQMYLDGHLPQPSERTERDCLQSSEQERRAAEAERASVRYKQIEYMKRFLGDRVMGKITSVTEWGLYVEIKDAYTEGMIRLADIEGDYYEYDARNLCARGRRSNRVFKIGQEVEVEVAKLDLERRQMDLLLVQD